MLNDMAREYEGRATIVGVDAAAEDTETDARQFVREFELAFPIVRGSRSVKDEWGVRGYPETFLVDRHGRVVAHVNGPVDEETVRALIDGELKRA
jgi:cytochrome c biogenesis protein CcmG/thiol:disulfide interchange protein DsbE